MTAIAASRDAKRKVGEVVAYEVQAAEIIYKGVPVFLDASDKQLQSNDGTSIALGAGDIFVGISYEGCDNSAGADGAKKCRVWKTGVFLLPFSDTLADADIGKPVYVNDTTDDSVVTVTAAASMALQVTIGRLVGRESASLGWVRIDQYVDTAVAALD